MIDRTTFSACVDELTKLSAPWSKITGRIGEAVAPHWKKLETASEAIRSPTWYGAAAKRVVPGAALGAGTGAIVDKEDRGRGALIGAIGGGAAGAALPAVIKGVHDVGLGAGKLIHQPVKTLKDAWRAQSPVERGVGGEAPMAVTKLKEKTTAAEKPGWFQRLRYGGKEKAQRSLTDKAQRQYGHLVDPSGQARSTSANLLDPARAQQTWGGKIKATAEELSRRGWTGMGPTTKYLPIGAKGQTAIYAGMGAPVVYDAATGQAPLSEGAGEIGSQLGFLAAGGVPRMGIVGTLALSDLVRRGFAAPVQAFEKEPSVQPEQQVTPDWAPQTRTSRFVQRQQLLQQPAAPVGGT